MIIYYLLLSIVQAATEFLPVSSSGHLLFLKGIFEQSDIPLFFDIILHLGSLTAILFFYRWKLFHTFKSAADELKSKNREKPSATLIVYIIISTIVTFMFYLLFKDTIEVKFESPQTLKYTFLITSVILFLTLFIKPNKGTTVSGRKLFLPVLVGLFQAVAIMPGISRSGSTIACLLFLKIEKEEAAYYSFFLAIPAIFGAFIFKIREIENLSYISDNWGLLLLSFLCSAFFSYLFLKLLTYVITKNKFWVFSFYTIALAITSIIIF